MPQTKKKNIMKSFIYLLSCFFLLSFLVDSTIAMTDPEFINNCYMNIIMCCAQRPDNFNAQNPALWPIWGNTIDSTCQALGQ